MPLIRVLRAPLKVSRGRGREIQIGRDFLGRGMRNQVRLFSHHPSEEIARDVGLLDTRPIIALTSLAGGSQETALRAVSEDIPHLFAPLYHIVAHRDTQIKVKVKVNS